MFNIYNIVQQVLL